MWIRNTRLYSPIGLLRLLLDFAKSLPCKTHHTLPFSLLFQFTEEGTAIISPPPFLLLKKLKLKLKNEEFIQSESILDIRADRTSNGANQEVLKASQRWDVQAEYDSECDWHSSVLSHTLLRGSCHFDCDSLRNCDGLSTFDLQAQAAYIATRVHASE